MSDMRVLDIFSNGKQVYFSNRTLHGFRRSSIRSLPSHAGSWSWTWGGWLLRHGLCPALRSHLAEHELDKMVLLGQTYLSYPISSPLFLGPRQGRIAPDSPGSVWGATHLPATGPNFFVWKGTWDLLHWTLNSGCYQYQSRFEFCLLFNGNAKW